MSEEIESKLNKLEKEHNTLQNEGFRIGISLFAIAHSIKYLGDCIKDKKEGK